MKLESFSEACRRNVRVCRTFLTIAALAACLFALLIGPGIQDRAVSAQILPPNARPESAPEISAEALAQIQALADEKTRRTPAQLKMDSNLVYLAKMRRGERIAGIVPTLDTGVDVMDGGSVRIDIRANVTPRLLEKLAASGVIVTASFPQYRTISAIARVDQLESVAGMNEVFFVQPEPRGDSGSRSSKRRKLGIDDLFQQNYAPGFLDVPAAKPSFEERAKKVREFVTEQVRLRSPETGTANSQGDTTHQSDLVRANIGVNGTNIKIGVISTGVSTLPARQATGDLPMDVTVLPGQYGSLDEGTAMLEIIHDIAPGAKLYYADGLTGSARMAQNYKDLRAAGCDIIVDDIFYFAENPFQDGQAPSVVSTSNGAIITQAMYDVAASGGLIFSLACNHGNKNDNRSSVYQGDFTSGGTNALLPGGTVHDFGGGQQYTEVTQGSGNPTVLFWSDPLGGSTNDYDLYVLNAAGTAVIRSSTNVQNGTQDPFEQAAASAASERIVVFKKTGAADRFFYVSVVANGAGTLSVSTEGAIRGHNMASAAVSVGAAPALAPGPFPAAFSSSSPSELFTADGPRRLFFQANGTPFTPGNFSSTGGTVRQKPDITAADRVTTTTPGFIPFAGTSAAAPHAGALAALIKSANPSLTNAQIVAAMTSTAIDIELAGTDRDTGVGIVMPLPALTNLGITTARAVVNTGTRTVAEASPTDGDGRLEPNERGTLLVQDLRNVGVANATGVTATLSTTTAGVTIMSPSTIPFSDIAAGGTSSANTTPYRFLLGDSFSCGTPINFVLTVNFSGGGSNQQVLNFDVDTAATTTITSTLDTIAPVAGSNFTTGTGLQTARLNRNGDGSSCTLPKGFPGTFGSGTRRYDSYTFTANRTGCTEVTLTQTSGTSSALFSAVYGPGGFVPATLSSNYLADPGLSFALNSPEYYKYAFASTAGQQFTVVVNEVNDGAGIGANYTLKVGGAPVTACNVVSTAAGVSASGRVTRPDGRGVRGATVTMTDSDGRVRVTATDRLGSYRFDDVSVGQTVVIAVSMERFRFLPQVITIADNVSELNFYAK